MSKRKKAKGMGSASFERTCNKPYDRSLYEVVLKDGRKYYMDDWDYAHAFWYQNHKSGLLSHINVI